MEPGIFLENNLTKGKTRMSFVLKTTAEDTIAFVF
jgi:hypothetical protein